MRQPCLSMAITSNTMPQVCQHQLVVYRYSAFSPHILSSTHDTSHLRTHLTHHTSLTHLIHTPHLHTLLSHASYTLPPPLAQAGGGAQLTPAVRISTGLAHTAQFTWLLSRLLDTPLPHPMKLEKIIWSVIGKERVLVPRAHTTPTSCLSVCVSVCVCVHMLPRESTQHTAPTSCLSVCVCVCVCAHAA